MKQNIENKARILGTGTWISLGSPIVTEVISMMQFDWLLFDLEHGFMQEHDILPNLMAVKSSGTKVIVRVSEFRSGLIARLLDWGVAGIMMPHVSSSEEAARVVGAMRYPPFGKRGFSSSSRSFGYGENAPRNITEWEPPLFIAQIENYEGVQNANSIAATKGVDMLFIGPRDLRLDLSVRKSADERITFQEAISLTVKAAISSGKQAGILVSPEEDISDLCMMGFSAFAIGADLAVLRSGYKKIKV